MKDCKVLVVDDNQDAADSTAQVLQAYGFELTRVAYSSAEVDAMIDAELYRPDVILMDLAIPGESGYAIAARILVLHPKCKIVAVTGYGRREDQERTTIAGFTHHLVKPVDPKLLENIVRHQCEDAHHCEIN